MSLPPAALNTVDSEDKWVYLGGGISAIVFGIAYIVIIALFIPLGSKPTGAAAWLAHTAANSTAWWAVLALSVLTDFLLVPVALSLYLALKGINRALMLLAIAFVGLFTVLDLALTWTNIAALITLGASYAAATSDAQKTAVVTAATYPATVVDTNLIFVYNTLTLSIGILLTGLVMLRGIFNKLTAYSGLATGVLGVVAVASSFMASSVSTAAVILASILTTVWVLFVGFRLLRLGRP